MFCPNCSKEITDANSHFCTTCGTPLVSDMENTKESTVPQNSTSTQIPFNPSNTSNGTPNAAQASPFMNAPTIQDNTQFCNAKPKKSKKAIISIGIIGVLVFLSVLLSQNTKPKNFNDRYQDIADNAWCEIAADGSWMRLDTNPDNIDSDYAVLYYSSTAVPCFAKIEQVNTDLGFSSALIERMNSTTALQGRQTEENDNYRVSWTYHPDKGLDVLYEIKN